MATQRSGIPLATSAAPVACQRVAVLFPQQPARNCRDVGGNRVWAENTPEVLPFPRLAVPCTSLAT